MQDSLSTLDLERRTPLQRAKPRYNVPGYLLDTSEGTFHV